MSQPMMTTTELKKRPGSPEEYLTARQLRSDHGWTPAMMRRFLGEPERRETVRHRFADHYKLALVTEVEGTAEFQAAKADAAQRRSQREPTRIGKVMQVTGRRVLVYRLHNGPAGLPVGHPGRNFMNDFLELEASMRAWCEVMLSPGNDLARVRKPEYLRLEFHAISRQDLVLFLLR